MSVFLSQKQAFSQIVIGQPSLNFSQACANSAFNSFSASFVFSPESSVEASNQFIIELSNADGDFSEAEVIYTSTSGEFSTSPATVSYSIPEITAGEAYRIRVKSTSPVATSSASVSFAAYYKLQDAPFTINNLVSTGVFCTGSSYLLTIDNPGTGTNDSPLNYPSLTFNWFRETSETTSVFIAQGNSLAVSEEGTYFVETNYGSCTSDSFSNRVTITEVNASDEAEVTIVSSLGNPFCPDLGFTTLQTITGNTYQWFKDGVEIEGATDQMYETEESGVFSVQVDLGDCSAFGSIDLLSQLFESAINVNEITPLVDGETLTVTVTNTAISPIFDWYRNEALILGENSNSLVITQFGEYEVVITETSGCTASRSFQFIVEEAIDPFPDVQEIPNIISPNDDMINDTWVIPLQYTSGTGTDILILSEQGNVVFQTKDYQNNWPNNDLGLTEVNQLYYYIITPVDGNVKKGSITVIK